MSLVIRPCHDGGLTALRALARDPSLAREFEPLQTDAGFDDLMGDPHLPRELRWIAWLDGTPAGFCFCFLAPTHVGSFAMARLGVVEPFRRRGVATALLAATCAAIEPIRERHGLRELSVSAWEANPAAEAFATRHGFRHARDFWRMERPRGPVGTPVWPAGVSLRIFDGSEPALLDFNDAYNRAFAEHYHFMRLSPDETKAVAAQSHFRPDGDTGSNWGPSYMLSSVTSPKRPEKMSMCVTPANVSFVNCGKSSIVISPYFCFSSALSGSGRSAPPRARNLKM